MFFLFSALSLQSLFSRRVGRAGRKAGSCLLLLPLPAALQEQAVKQRRFSCPLHVLGGSLGCGVTPGTCGRVGWPWSLGGEDNPEEKVPLQPCTLLGAQHLLQALGGCGRCPAPSWDGRTNPPAIGFSHPPREPFCASNRPKVTCGWGKENVKWLCKGESGTSPSRAKIGRFYGMGLCKP